MFIHDDHHTLESRKKFERIRMETLKTFKICFMLNENRRSQVKFRVFSSIPPDYCKKKIAKRWLSWYSQNILSYESC